MLLIWILIGVCPPVAVWISRKLRQLSEKRTAGIFEHHYLEAKSFYMYRFKTIPCTTYVDEIDINKAFEYLDKNSKDITEDIYQACYYDWTQSKQVFSKTLFVLKNRVMVELMNDYARILYPNYRYSEADNLVNIFSAYKLPQKQEAYEINIITLSRDGLELKQVEIKPTLLDIGMYYNDDFKEVDETIKARLNRESDKGIILLHGLPGTGKTTYLRHLIGGLKKKVLFVSPSVAGNLMNPEFIDLLIENPNSVLIIEDAENIMMDRKYNSDSSVSNLLNLSDGLMSDCLSVQIICTFNSSVNLIDSALMRKGRLIAKYEFGKLGVEKANRLSKHLGFDVNIDQPMTIAEIANPTEKTQPVERTEVIGFRRQVELMN
ncbi:AAA family ATPase [Lacibacter sediminis]|uniref:AAA family ATPase n=2 Tax=Lacibacter sediminis TaxID=2760713 RepID=A0A7G5XMG2_9BACT|nr:AAA family ATPase [Lacibacter sediminis]